MLGQLRRQGVSTAPGGTMGAVTAFQMPPTLFCNLLGATERGAAHFKRIGLAIARRRLHANGAQKLAIDEEVAQRVPGKEARLADLGVAQIVSHVGVQTPGKGPQRGAATPRLYR